MDYDRVRYLYLSNAVVFPWHEVEDTFKSPAAQLDLFQRTAGDPVSVSYPPPSEYLIKFLKTWIKKCGDFPVIDEVYEYLGDVMTKQSSDHGYRIYYFDDRKVILKETYAMCSKGTTGLRTWQAALYLTSWISSNSDIFHDKRVLELGCGTGLAGCLASKVCDHMTFSDYHSDVLGCVKHNVEVNSITNCSLIALDWRSAIPEIDIDIIIAADVVFDPNLLPHLVTTIMKLLQCNSKNNAVCYICVTVRNTSTYEEFEKELKLCNLSFTPVTDVVTSVYLTGKEDIKLLKVFY